MRPLVVSHTERVDYPIGFIVGLLRYRPADVRRVRVFLEDALALAVRDDPGIRL